MTLFATGATLLALLVGAGAIVLSIITAMSFRTVVSTNDADVIQRRNHTFVYGKGQTAGNVYYKWPSWVPYFGVQLTRMPVTVFSINLKDYAAYDKGRLPFIIDIIGFFRVAEPAMAAERLASIDDLKQQLTGILQGAIRSILASVEIEEILEGRGKFGEMFTHAVDDQLKNWGVQTVKTIELMDIRDANESKVIANIMMKKKSLIEMQSRVEVAKNGQTAQVAEIEAKQTVGVRQQEAEQAVNIRQASQVQETQVAQEKAKQTVAEQQAITASKNMAVQQVNEVRKAEIEKQVQIVQAEQQKEVAVINADGQKQQTILIADGQLEQRKREAEAIEVKGNAEGSAKYAIEIAPVNAQIALAKEIGTNKEYQQYLLTIRQIEAAQAVGISQATALTDAEVKIIATSGSAAGGLKTAADLFTPQGGIAIASALEGLAQTPVGAAVLERVTGKATNGGTLNGTEH